MVVHRHRINSLGTNAWWWWLEVIVAVLSCWLGFYWARLQLQEKSCHGRPSSLQPATTTTAAAHRNNVWRRLGVPIQPNSTWVFLHAAGVPSTSTNAITTFAADTRTTPPQSCDSVDTVFLNSHDIRTCLAFIPSVASGSWPDTKSGNVDLLLTLERLNKKKRQSKFVPVVSWYDDHHHKPPWRLSSPPKPVLIHDMWWPLLEQYLSTYPQTVQAWQTFLKAQSFSSNHPPFKNWIVLVTNAHHLDLLHNWVCAAAPQLITRTLVVALDQPTAFQISRQYHLLTFFHPSLTAAVGTAEYSSREYGTVMLIAKVFVVHLILSASSASSSHDNFLFHDVDVIPLRGDYLDAMAKYLHQKDSPVVDIVFQYDSWQSRDTPPEYSPWFVNTGFYMVRGDSVRARDFAQDLVRHGDLVLRSNSHQAVVSLLLSQHVSRYGLKIRVLNEEEEQVDLFPGGYHFHHKWDYMRAMISGVNDRQKRGVPQPYVFHMNYNDQKETKLQFLQQMGWWFLSDDGNNDGSSNKNNDTCVHPPIPKCHYRDKPSIVPCREFPAVETGESFW